MAAFDIGRAVTFVRAHAQPYDDGAYPQTLLYVDTNAEGTRYVRKAVHLPRIHFAKLAKKIHKDDKEGRLCHFNEIYRRDDELHLALDIDLKKSQIVDGVLQESLLFARWCHEKDRTLCQLIKAVGSILSHAYQTTHLRKRANIFDCIAWTACREDKISFHLHYSATRFNKRELTALVQHVKSSLLAVPTLSDYASLIDSSPISNGNLRMPLCHALTENDALGLVPTPASQLRLVGAFSADGYLIEPGGTHYHERLYCDCRSPDGGAPVRYVDLAVAMCLQNAYHPPDFKCLDFTRDLRCRGGWPSDGRHGGDSLPTSLSSSAFHSRSDFVVADDKRAFIDMRNPSTGNSVSEILRAIAQTLSDNGPQQAILFASTMCGVINSENSVYYKVRDPKTGRPVLQREPISNVHKAQWPQVLVTNPTNAKQVVQVSLLQLFIQNSNGYDGRIFVPCSISGEHYQPTVGGCINMWTGFKCYAFDYGPNLNVEGFLSDPTSYLSLILFHIWDTYCCNDDDLFVAFVCWMAHILQLPHVQTLRCPVIYGRQGVGKSAIIEKLYARGILTYHQIICENAEHIFGQFNSVVHDCVLIVASESIFRGNKAMLERLKHQVTGETLSIEAKHCDMKQVPNYTNMALVTNALTPIHGEDLRRYMLIRCSPKWHAPPAGMDEADFIAAKRDYMSALDAACSSEDGAVQFSTFLLSLDLTHWLANRHTIAVAHASDGSVKRDSLPEEVQLIVDMIRQRTNLCQRLRHNDDNLGHLPVFNFDPRVNSWTLNPPIISFDSEWAGKIRSPHVKILNLLTALFSLGVTTDGDHYTFPAYAIFCDTFDRLYPNVNARQMFSSQALNLSQSGFNLPNANTSLPAPQNVSLLYDKFTFIEGSPIGRIVNVTKSSAASAAVAAPLSPPHATKRLRPTARAPPSPPTTLDAFNAEQQRAARAYFGDDCSVDSDNSDVLGEWVGDDGDCGD
jgi:hypothetical protein